MFTVCPKCALTLVVTAADLKVGQGYVRCGRCSNVFNALVGLAEDRHGVAAAAAAASPASPAALPPEPEPEPEPESEPEPEPEPDTEDVPDEALEFNAEATDVTEVFVEPRPGPHDVSSGTFETIVLQADDLLAQSEANAATAGEGSVLDALGGQDAANDLSADSPQAANDPALPDGEPADAGVSFDRSRIEAPRPRAASRPAVTTPHPSVTQAIEAWERDRAAEESEAVADDFTAPPDSVRSRRPLVLWSAGIAALVLILGVQLVHHNRHDLAVEPRLRAPLSSIYGTLGLTLVPRWDLAGYDVRQLGASAEPATGGQGVLTVRASVQNAGENPQPLPLLRVTVQDRFGNRIASRDVPPATYAPRGAGASGLLDAGQRVDAEIRLADPGPNAVGFELDACLAGEGGRIACANDARAR